MCIRDSFMVLHRWFNGDRKYSRLVTVNVDGTEMYNLSDDDMVSHCYWKDDQTIIAFENKKKTGAGYYLMLSLIHICFPRPQPCVRHLPAPLSSCSAARRGCARHSFRCTSRPRTELLLRLWRILQQLPGALHAGAPPPWQKNPAHPP